MNLEGKDLKVQFEKDLVWAFNKIKSSSNPAGVIVFHFMTFDDFELQDFRVDYFCQSFKINNVDITVYRSHKNKLLQLNKKATIRMILQNLHYSGFCFDKRVYYCGKPMNHGHGEYWASDTIHLYYYREA